MNNTKNTIGWCDLTWNPVTGCLHGCWYCYARKMFTRFHRSFEPTFHPERLNEPWELKKPSKIFCCSVADLFAEWTPVEWRDAVLESINLCPINHTFQLLTKNPERIPEGFYGKQDRPIWIGATITSQSEMWKAIQLYHRVWGHVNRFLSFEPLLEAIDIIQPHLENYPYLNGIDWIIIGKLTGSRKVPLQKEWVQSLIDQARQYNIPIFIKNNVGWPEKIQEFPK